MSAQDHTLTIAGKTYRSRLLVGSGKYASLEQMRDATEASGSEIITVAIRRVNIGQDPKAPSLLDFVPPTKYTILPNTAGCYNAEDAIYTLQMARELLNGRGIPFAEKMLKTDAEVAELTTRLGAEAAVPSLIVGTQSFRGFDSAAWTNLLDLAGYPTTAPYGAKPSGAFTR